MTDMTNRHWTIIDVHGNRICGAQPENQSPFGMRICTRRPHDDDEHVTHWDEVDRLIREGYTVAPTPEGEALEARRKAADRRAFERADARTEARNRRG